MQNNVNLTSLIKKVPFTYIWSVRFLVDKPKTVLDIGCGTGEFMSLIKNDSWKITGIDIHKKTAKVAMKSKVYKDVLVGDLIKVCKKLVKEKKKYDLIFCSQVIEHITKEEGEELLNLMEELTNKKIYIGTPRGYLKQGEEHIEDNKYQDHKSGWVERDFVSRGYKVYGVGLSLIWSEDGLIRKSNKYIKIFLTLVSFVFSPLTFFVPSFASGLMAIKDMSKNS